MPPGTPSLTDTVLRARLSEPVRGRRPPSCQRALFYKPSQLTWGSLGEERQGTFTEEHKSPRASPLNPGRHIWVLCMNCPKELGHVSRSPAVLHKGTQDPKKNISSTRVPAGRHDGCVFGFTLQLLLRQRTIYCNARSQ